MLKANKTNFVYKYIPICERGKKDATIICYSPMNKRRYDDYLASLTDLSSNKPTAKIQKASENLFRNTLAKDENGVYIYNVVIDEEFIKEIRDLETAVDFLMNLGDINVANEIENVLRSSSTLTEDEEKN